jgi:hypothetical protein
VGNRQAVGCPPYVDDACSDPIFGFCPFRARVIGGDFSQGVALCYGLFAPLGRVGFADVFYDPIVGYADVWGVGISTRFQHLRDEGKPRPYNVNVFLVLPMRFTPQLSACADAIHQESPAVSCPPYVAL